MILFFIYKCSGSVLHGHSCPDIFRTLTQHASELICYSLESIASSICVELNIFLNFKMAANTSSVKMSYCFKTFLYFLVRSYSVSSDKNLTPGWMMKEASSVQKAKRMS
jgi:hypothetical protein